MSFLIDAEDTFESVPESGDPIRVRWVTGEETLAFAAAELQSYLRTLTGRPVYRSGRDAYDPDLGGFWIGTPADIDDAMPPDVENPDLDDAIHIDVDPEGGVIAGNVPRAALIAVYRYLREQGCRWVRPGSDGEIVPRKDALDPVRVAETPDHRHRGVTIEGATSVEHVLDLIDWLPKVGMNSYFLQFFEAYPFFERWYTHEDNPYWAAEPFDEERARELHRRCVAAIERRGLIHHAVGHGWTARALGLPDRGWEGTTEDVTGEIEPFLAEVDGERGFHRDIPVNTELCYSNPDARRRMIDAIAEYVESHPEVDVLHVWGSDGHNNHCECDDCRGRRPTDLYVRLLNELDAELSERGVETRIAFLAYTDLLWPPETERLENEERFSLMFAPITREYTRTYGDVSLDDIPAIPPYERNDLEYPSNLAENVAFLSAWQDVFEGDAFLFDYHLRWPQYDDPGHARIARVIVDDVANLRDVGLDGDVGSQNQRTFFPTGLAMTAMAETLWDADRDYDEIATEYFRAAFGRETDRVRAYLEDLSAAFAPLFEDDAHYIRGGTPDFDSDDADSFAAIPGIVAEFLPVIERNRDHDDPAIARSWELLDHHADLCLGLATALSALARGDRKTAGERWEATRELAQRREVAIHDALDVFWFVRFLDAKFADDRE